MHIRFVTPADVPALRTIYARYIDTPITFEYTLPSETEFAARIAAISGEYPYLVCEEHGVILGYAYAHRHMERAAYQWGAELSVYLDTNATSKGLGKKLYAILIEILALQNVKTVYGGVTMPNAKSEALHASLGFHVLGTYRNAGYKNGQWLDVAWFEKEIGPYDANPPPFIPLCAIDAAKMQGLLI
ncbi:MAG: Phosphinothricin N-acetyltransferase [Desulfovibrio sp.]